MSKHPDLTRQELIKLIAAANNQLVLTGLSLSGVDLSGLNLTGADLTRANLESANLTGADLTGVSLQDEIDREYKVKTASEELKNRVVDIGCNLIIYFFLMCFLLWFMYRLIIW